MSTPANIACPCDGNAFKPYPSWTGDWEPDCLWCKDNHRVLGIATDGKCLGTDGWPILAAAGADVARERGGKR